MSFNTLEIFVFAYHGLVLLFLLALLVDYALGIDKLSAFIGKHIERFGYDDDNPVTVFMGSEFLCFVILCMMPILGYPLAMTFIAAITILYWIVFTIFGVLMGLGYLVEKIRASRLK